MKEQRRRGEVATVTAYGALADGSSPETAF
jgi:hypothetical protein